MSADMVNHPSHYTDGKYEVINFIESMDLDKNFYVSNAIKYISRAGKKDPSKKEEDLKKAIWYLERYLCAHHNSKEEHIDVFDYIADKGLSTNLGQALLRILLGTVWEPPYTHEGEKFIEGAISDIRKEIDHEKPYDPLG